MLSSVGMFVGGLLLLLVGGRLLVSASVDTARRLRISPLLIGLTLVAWGTSAPELAMNVIAASKGLGGLAVGNVVGANICNVALVLGACAVINPLVVQERLIRVEIWLNAGIQAILCGFALTMGFSRMLSTLMLAVFAGYSLWTIMSSLASQRAVDDPLGEDPSQGGPPMGWLMIALAFIGGLALLSFGGALASDGASRLALALGMSAAVVGVTIVSIGTTMPELVTGILAVRRSQTDLAMGNVLGSCLFNSGAVLGVAGLIGPAGSVPSLSLPLIFMAVFAVMLIPISRTFGKRIARIEGMLLLAGYTAFLVAAGLVARQAP
jgi:cation:H+ antiporter